MSMVTNSTVEGFRLEGFDNPPATLRSVEAFNHTWDKLHRVFLK